MNSHRLRTGFRLLAIIAVPIALVTYFNGCADEPTDRTALPTGPAANDVVATHRLSATAPEAAVIDFETPSGIAESEDRGVYVDPGSGVRFTAIAGMEANRGQSGGIGLVKGVSAGLCAWVKDTGRVSGARGSGGHMEGDHSLSMRVEFPEPLPPPVTISVELYTKAGAVIRTSLLSPSETEVSSLTEPAAASVDERSSFSDAFTSRTVVSITTHEPVVIAVFAVTEPVAGSGRTGEGVTGSLEEPAAVASAFVIDNLRFGSFIVASLDIRPGSCPNPFNPKSQGVLPVALMGSPDFDVDTIDLTSLRLEGAAPIRNNAARGPVPGSPGAACECGNAGEPDEFDDLTLKFRTQDIADALGSPQRDEVRVLRLTGLLSNGTPFEASDCVRIAGAQEPVSEVVSAPSTPEGPTQVQAGVAGNYCTQGATSTEGHPVEYQFDFNAEGEHDITAWSSSPCAEHFWPSFGTYVVRARARCQSHPDVVSSWSGGLAVLVTGVEEPPEIRFLTSITRVLPGGIRSTITNSYDPAVLDTVGTFRPFVISYHGIAHDGLITAYQFFSLTPGVDLDGAGVWTTDTSDTVRVFPNVGESSVPSGTFRLAAQCKDENGTESVVDMARFQQGVCQIAVNFDPDTRLYQAENSYSVGGQRRTEYVNFFDEIPDTVPYNSWIRIDYRGWDSPLDSTLCRDDMNRCIRYQVQFERDSDRIPGAHSLTRWLPVEPKDSNPSGTADSTSMNIGSVEYEIRARSVDEWAKPDGTPAGVRIVGNFNPTMDSFAIQNHTGEIVAEDDTLMWDWWHPAREGFDIDDPSNILRTKEFYFVIRGSGHDHPKDPDGSGVKSWLYDFLRTDDPTISGDFARSGSWVDGVTVNELSDTFIVVFSYPFDDLEGDEVFANLPDWLNQGYDFSLMGRDTNTTEPFNQMMFLDGQAQLIEYYNAGVLGRWTDQEHSRFYFAIRR